MSAKISVIIPVYNVEKYLPECLDSIISQTLDDIEIICINDGSTDSCAEIIEEYAARDNRIKKISKENSGLGDTYNRGILAASAPYIGFVEPDDYIKPDMFKTLYDIAINYDLDMVKSDSFRFKDHAPPEYYRCSMHKSVYNKVCGPDDIVLISPSEIAHWAGIYRTDFIIDNQLFFNSTPGASYQDCGFFYNVCCSVRRFYLLDQAFYMYRTDNPNASVKNKTKIYCICDEFAFIHAFLDRHRDIKDQFIKWVISAQIAHYFYTYDRISSEYKAEFLKMFRKDLKHWHRNKWLDFSEISSINKIRIKLLLFSSGLFNFVSRIWNIIIQFFK